MADEGSLEQFQAQANAMRVAAQLDPDGLPDLAAALTNLSACLSDHDRSYEALPVSQEAVACYRVVVAKDDRYLREYAIALRNLAIDLGNVGNLAEALAAINDSVGIRERLARTDNKPENYAAWAESLRNRGHLLGDAQRHQDAVASFEQAAELVQQLAQAGHSDYLEDVADSEHSLAIALHDLADATRDEMTLRKAATRAGNAVRIRRGLHRKYPAFADDLAGALYTLAAIQGVMGEGGDARKALKEAKKLSGRR